MPRKYAADDFMIIGGSSEASKKEHNDCVACSRSYHCYSVYIRILDILIDAAYLMNIFPTFLNSKHPYSIAIYVIFYHESFNSIHSFLLCIYYIITLFSSFMIQNVL